MKHLLTFIFCGCAYLFTSAQIDSLISLPKFRIKVAVFNDSVFAYYKKAFIGKTFVFRPYLNDECEIPQYTRVKCVDLIRNPKKYDEGSTEYGLIDLKVVYKDTVFCLFDLATLDTTNTYTGYRLDGLIQKFGYSNWKLIMQGKVKIGMTKQMCRQSWGEPDDINKTITKNYVREQWVYGNSSYLYFLNGILESIQN